MIKRCMDCGLKMTLVNEKYQEARYECAVCNAHWVNTIRTASTWEKVSMEVETKEIANIKDTGFKVKLPSAEDIIKEANKTDGLLTADKIGKVAKLYLDGVPFENVFGARRYGEPSAELIEQRLKSMTDITKVEFEEHAEATNSKISSKIDSLIDDHKTYLGHEVLSKNDGNT